MPAGYGIPVSQMTDRQLVVAVPLVLALGVGNIFLFGYAFVLEWAGSRRPVELLSAALVVVCFAAFTAHLEARYVGELLKRWRARREYGPGGRMPDAPAEPGTAPDRGGK